MFSGGQNGKGAALPVADGRAVMGREAGVVRPAGACAEDTARLDDDARHARRLPIDPTGQRMRGGQPQTEKASVPG